MDTERLSEDGHMSRSIPGVPHQSIQDSGSEGLVTIRMPTRRRGLQRQSGLEISALLPRRY
jgi:hypothetical protein